MTTTDYGLTELRSLSTLIQVAIDKLEGVLAATKQSFPSQDTPFDSESEAVRRLPEVEAATNDIVAAAAQLIATARPPVLSVALVGGQVCLAHPVVLSYSCILCSVPCFFRFACGDSSTRT